MVALRLALRRLLTPLRLEALESRAVLNAAPLAPAIVDPALAGQVVSGADVHLEIAGFVDPDVADTHTGTAWEIWTTSGTIERVWSSTPTGGVDLIHTHLGDGVFEGSFAGHTELDAARGYQLRVRVRDSSGDAASEWSPYATRSFVTAPLWQLWPLEARDVHSWPAPALLNAQGAAIELPAGTAPARVLVESAQGELLLELRGQAATGNLAINPPPLGAHAAVRVRVIAGESNLVLPEVDLSFSDDGGAPQAIYLPSLTLAPSQAACYWVSTNGSTFVGSAGQSAPDLTVLARGAPVPWTAAPGYKIEVVATGFQLPVNIAFVPNPGPNPADPLYYVSELYGTIKVVRRDGSVGDYTTGLLNFNPTGNFPGSGEQGLTGLVVDPASGDVFASMVYSSVDGVENVPHYPKVDRFHSTNGGQTAATRTTILNMVGEIEGQSHQVSHLSIGPDGCLYVHNGDGFDTASAQNLSSFHGKVLRLTLGGAAVPSNPFFDTSDGITARDYVYAYGFRNPFGGAWRAADGAHYEVENGPSVDRLAKVTPGTNYLWDGTDASMVSGAIYNWSPSVAPVNLTFVQAATFGGSGFPADKQDHAFVSQSGPTWASGPQGARKAITEFALDAAGNWLSGPTVLAQYNGAGKATAAGLAAGPDGLYFTDLYKDLNYATPIDRGANVLRIRYVGNRPPVAVEDSYTIDEDSTLATVAPATEVFAQTGSVWKYLDNGSDQGSAWRTPGFDDAAWAAGPSQLGYGDGDEATVVGYIDTNPVQAGVQRNITTYFRRSFVAANVADVSALSLQLLRDDGAAVYLNGVEIARSNLPGVLGDNGLTYGTPATDVIVGADESAYQTWAIRANRLVEGTNVLAVEIHQQSSASTDISFDLRLLATRKGTGVIANDVDVDFDLLTATLVAPPSHAAAFVWNGNGAFCYTPAADYFGVDSFAYVVDDGALASNVVTVTIDVVGANDPPVAAAGGPYAAIEGSSVLLDGSGSWDPDDAAATLSYEWDLDYDGTFQVDLSGAVQPLQFPDDVPLRTIALRVTDPQQGSATATAILAVENAAPSVRCGSDATIELGDSFDMHGWFVDPGADTWTASVDYADGAGFVPLALATDKWFWLHATYDQPGTYPVVMRVEDDDGGVGEATVTVRVLATRFVVGGTQNAGPGSLRQAVLDANANWGVPHTIAFEIPGGGPQAIDLNSPLPALADPVTFDVPAGTTVEIGTLSPFSVPDVTSLTKAGGGLLVVGGNQVHSPGSALVVAAGTARLTSDGGENLSVDVAGELQLAATQHLASLRIDAGGTASMTADGGQRLVVAALSIDPGAALDLADNDLIVRATAATSSAVLAEITQWLRTGSAGLVWTGLGIRSLAAANDATYLTGLGAMLNDAGGGNPYHQSFDGEPLDAHAVLVKYTFYGDADLSGTVDGTDYALTDNGFNNGLAAWFDGDFDYSGAIDGTDYALIDNAFNHQAAPLAAAAAPAADERGHAPRAALAGPLFGSDSPIAAGPWLEVDLDELLAERLPGFARRRGTTPNAQAVWRKQQQCSAYEASTFQNTLDGALGPGVRKRRR